MLRPVATMPRLVAASRALGLPLLLFALLLGASLAPRAGEVQRFDRALSVAGEAASFPENASAVHEVTLPDDGSTARRGDAPLWYRLRFDAAPGPALYLDRHCTAIEVQLNGVRLHADGHANPARTLCRAPLLLELPPALLRPTGNALDFKANGLPLARVASHERAFALPAPQFGSADALEPLRAARERQHSELPRLSAVALGLLGVFMLAVAGRPGGWRAELLHYGLLSIGLSLLSATVWLREGPFGLEAAEWVGFTLAPFVAASAVLFLVRMAGVRVRAFEAALLAQCLVVPATLLLAGRDRLFLLAGSWSLVLALEIALACAFAVKRRQRLRSGQFIWVASLLLLVALAGLAQFAVSQGWIASFDPPWPPLVGPLAFVALGLRLLHVELTALRSADASARALIDKRVGEAAAEAERTYAQLAELRIEQVIERERKRIAGDLHDDLGAKLLTIVHTSESESISTLAREALEEMRLSVRGLTGKPVKLADALGDWRAEFVSRLGQANIGAQWQNPAEEPQQTLPARAYVQTTRILREAVSNIIKHSGAARCVVTGKVQDGDFVLTIQDNGHGISMELDGTLDRGHGMASMKQRAKQLQGQCLVESGPGFGTVIRLTIPL